MSPHLESGYNRAACLGNGKVSELVGAGRMVEVCGRQCFQEEEVVSCPILLRPLGGQGPRVLGKFAAWVLVSLTSAASAGWA